MKKATLLIGTICLLIGLSQQKNMTTEGFAFEDSGEKVIICHIPPGNPDNAHAIEVSVNAVNAHLAHGDSLGDCSTSDADNGFNETILDSSSPSSDETVKTNTDTLIPTGL